MNLLWLVPLTVAVSFGLTWLVRRYALARQLVDVPNERSSHQVPTARGGGLAIVLTFLGVMPILYLMDSLPLSLFLAVCGGGGLVALIGFVDDHRHIPAQWRLLFHFLSAAWAIYWLDGLQFAPTGGGTSVPLWILNIAGILGVVWLVNLYNFMDGIDGIASIEAITVCFGGAVLFFVADPTGHLWYGPVLLLSSVAGFLYWNYPPARIFMGDTGSGFIGFVLGIFCIYAASIGLILFWAWVILLGVFIADSGVALIRRILRRRRLYEPHRSHAYQYAARKHHAHKSVSLAIGAINMFWLLPLAMLVGIAQLDWRLGLLIAYVPLIWLAFKYKSGAEELQEL